MGVGKPLNPGARDKLRRRRSSAPGQETGEEGEEKSSVGGSTGVASTSSGSSGAGSGANTAFIHKLCSMLEDTAMQDLIWWAPSQTSFLMCPTERFSKALSSYFKHANVASFVRQLNMYGFHKVNDHKGQQQAKAKIEASASGSNASKRNSVSPDSHADSSTHSANNIWEFKHSSSAFRRGDVEGLKLIKRRSSRYQASIRKNSNSTASTPLINTPSSSDQWPESHYGPRRSGSFVDTTHAYPYPPMPQAPLPSSAPGTTNLIYPPVDYFGAVPPHYPQQQQQQPPPPPPPPQQQQQQQQQQAYKPIQSQFHFQQQIPSQQQQQQQQSIQNPQQSHIQQSQQRPPINNKMSEVSQGAASQVIRPENFAAQNCYESAVDDLRNNNMDMIKILDLIHNLVSLSPHLSYNNQGKAEDIKRSTTPTSSQVSTNEAGFSPRNASAQQQNLEHLVGEITRLKNSTMYRLQRSVAMQQNPRSFQNAADYSSINPYSAYYQSRSNPLPNQNSVSSPALSQLTNSQQASMPQASQHMYYPTPFAPAGTAGLPNEYFGITNTKSAGASAPYLMMNPFEKKGSTSSSKNRHMSVLMDPLAPAPMSHGVSAVSTSVSPNPIQQQQHLQQQHLQHLQLQQQQQQQQQPPQQQQQQQQSQSQQQSQQQSQSQQQQHFYMGHPMASPQPISYGSNPKNHVKMLPTSNPDASHDARGTERRPLSPSIAEMPKSYLPAKASAKTPTGTPVNAMAYKPYFPYGTVPGAGPTSPSGGQSSQQQQMSIQSCMPHHNKAPQQITPRPNPTQRGPSPLNSHEGDACDQERLEKTRPPSPSAGDQDLNAARRDETTGSSSRLFSLLNYDPKEQSSKKTKF
ncbi:LANO_0H21374g1_1 [Lachancea nothofagi CBS 11611]|uniref:LANO_0H21374g1_1 n=1 Tax=Lachancea nothofagi CBS 11611 TaxID=1266666 RepID=A0A1G4KNS7_9SACH|nr:LANO_0H21374g1_1 [Lachancea nothofagi CBS 11611]